MKILLVITVMTTANLLLCWSGWAKSVSVAAEESLVRDTKPFMPDKKCRSVKIPGLRRQVLTAVKSGKRRWKSVAPGYINVPVTAELSGDVITMVVDIGGLMQSDDGGRSWHYISHQLDGGITGRSFFDFDISPINRQLIILGGNRIYKSSDGGKSWQEINRGLPPLRFCTRANGYGQVKFNADGSRIFTAMGTKIYFSVGWEKLLPPHYSHKMIFVSKDNGNSFNEIKFPTPFAVIKRIYPHPTKPDLLYLSFGDGEFYICRNAKSEQLKFKRIKLPPGYFVRAMSVSPDNPNLMLLSLTALKNRRKNLAKLLLSRNCTFAEISFKEVELKDRSRKAITGRDFMTVGFNPNRPRQVVIGSAHNPYLLISDDNLKSFRRLLIPAKFKRDGFEGHFYQQAERVYFGKSPYAVIVSRIGTWITRDNFKTLEDLTMTYANGWFGNRGVGSPANINGLAIAKDNVYFSAQDHRAWKSDGHDFTKWHPITQKQQNIPTQKVPWGQYTWFHQVEKIFASDDEKYIYINCNAFMGKGHQFRRAKKIFVSHDHGKSWQDITAALGQGAVYPAGEAFLKVLFDPRDSAVQWILFSESLYFSADGGNSFVKCSSKLFSRITRANRKTFQDVAYDAKHNILYLAVAVSDADLKRKLNHGTAPAALYRSSDRGRNWQVYDVGQNSIKALGVTGSGTLIIGTMKSADQPARLIVIPYSEKYSEKMVKMTMGDTLDEISANQLSFWPIRVDGEDILAYANINWVNSDRFFAQGPLLSTDGGKSFHWINYDLPSTNIWSADIKHGNIFIGTVFGLMQMKYR